MDLAVDVDDEVEAEGDFVDLALAADVLEAGEREAVICWMRTSAWREMLNVEVWVIRKRVSMCLLILVTLKVCQNPLDTKWEDERK
jgi:hypothetical protein